MSSMTFFQWSILIIGVLILLFLIPIWNSLSQIAEHLRVLGNTWLAMHRRNVDDD